MAAELLGIKSTRLLVLERGFDKNEVSKNKFKINFNQ